MVYKIFSRTTVPPYLFGINLSILTYNNVNAIINSWEATNLGTGGNTMVHKLSLGRVIAYDPKKREGVIQPADGSPTLVFHDEQFADNVTMRDIRAMTLASTKPEIGPWVVFILLLGGRDPFFIHALDFYLELEPITLE